MPTRVALQLGQLTCLQESEHGTEPYIWPIMICDDAAIPFVRVPTDDFAPSILANQMAAGQTVAAPSGMDLTLQCVFNDPAAGLVVLIVALFDKDSSPRKGTRAVFRHMEQRSLQFVQQRLAECRQSNGRRTDLRNALIARFDLRGAETGALNFLEEAVTKVSPGGFDDSIGFDLLTFSGSALTDRDVDFDLSKTGDRFTLRASLRLTSVLAPRCQAERDAVTQAEARVKGLQTQRQTLQSRLQTATPQQKAALVDLITRIAEVDLPPAEAALAQAKAALAACLARSGSTHAPLNPIIG